MAKKQKANPTPRQLRRQQQRESTAFTPSLRPGQFETTEQQVSTPESDLFGPGLMVPLFSGTIVLCYLMFARGLATLPGNELSRHQALFTAINAATLTGFQQARNPADYTAFGQLLTFLLMVTGILFSFLCGGSAVIRIARLPIKNVELLIWSIGSIFLVGIGGGLAIWLGGARGPNAPGFWADAFIAVSAFGNCGLTLGSLPSSNGPATLLVLLPLAILGGLGLPVLMEMVRRFRYRRGISQHSSTVLIWTAGSYIAFTLLLALVRWPGFNDGPSFWRSAFATASQQAINARSAGFAFQFASALPQAVTFTMVVVMLIGASPAGTAGGLKLTTLAELYRGMRSLLHGQSVARPFGLALLWPAIYLTMFVAATVALLITDPEIQLDRILFLSASALGNVGLSHNPIDATTAGLYVLSATMMLGRIAPVMMLWYTVDTAPEARVAVG